MFLRRYERRRAGESGPIGRWSNRVRTERRIAAAGRGLSRRSWPGASRSGWAQLGRNLSGKQRPSPSLFDPPHYDDPADDEPVLVDLQWRASGAAARLRRRVDGAGAVAAVGTGHALGRAGPRRDGKRVPWPVVAAILTIARFCKPSSELHIETTWYRGTALEDLLGVPVEKVHTDRLYEGLDWLLAAQGGDREASQGAVGTAVRPGVRPAVVRRDEHVFRGPVRGQRPGEARLLARQPPRLPAGLHRPGGDRPTGFPWGTRSSPATATTRRRWKRSSRRWRRSTAAPTASG